MRLADLSIRLVSFSIARGKALLISLSVYFRNRTGYRCEQRFRLRLTEVSPFTDGDLSKGNVHDPDALKGGDLIAQGFTHLADLTVKPLHQDDTETMLARLFHPAGKGFNPIDPYPLRHISEEGAIDVAVYPHEVFLLMLVTGPQDLVHDIAIVGQEDQAFRVFIEPPNGKYAFGIVDITDDVPPDIFVCSGGDAHRFIERKDDHFLLIGRFQDAAIHYHLIPFPITVAGNRNFIVQQYPAGLDQAVRFPSGAIAGFADVFVQGDVQRKY